MEVGFTTMQCFLIALFYAFAESRGPINFIAWGIQAPVFVGYMIGVIMGDPLQGATMGATIGMVYLGVIAVGASVPSNQLVGTTIGVAFAMAAGLGSEEALAIAVPVGVAGVFISSACMTVQIFSAQLLSKAAHKHNAKMMWFWGAFAMAMKILVYVVFMFVFLKIGDAFITNFNTAIPVWLSKAFSGGAALLPAVGLALGLKLIGSKGRIAYTVIAFVMAKAAGFSVLQISLMAAMLAVIMIYQQINSGSLSLDLSENSQTAPKKRLLSIQDSYKATFLYMTCYPWCFNMAKYGGEAFMLTMAPAMKKLYPGDREKQMDELLKHDTFFNTNTFTAGVIVGPVLAMEEERALGNTSITPESIDALKTSLMGPVAAVGDPLTQAVFDVIFKTIGMGMVLSGNVMGAWVTCLGMIFKNVILGYLTANVGFRYGSNLIEKLYSSGAMDTILDLGSMIGCCAFGALAASYLNVQVSGIEFQGMNLQTALFDSIMPGILSLSLLLVLFQLFRSEKVKPIGAVCVLFALGFVFGAIGIFG